MKIAALGTGMVGRGHAEKLLELGHEVVIGTNDVAKTLAETEPDGMGNPPFSVWQKENQEVRLVSFQEAAIFGEIIFEALNGQVAVKVLKKLEKELEGKILIDIANPLDFSQGFPPTLSVSNNDSLGEQIQRALPKTKVVKTFNTMTAKVQVNPQILEDGNHTVFVSGNDAEAKERVIEILKSYGWKDIIDLGDITTARGTEMAMPFWLRLMGAIKSPIFNYKIVRQDGD